LTQLWVEITQHFLECDLNSIISDGWVWSTPLDEKQATDFMNSLAIIICISFITHFQSKLLFIGRQQEE